MNKFNTKFSWGQKSDQTATSSTTKNSFGSKTSYSTEKISEGIELRPADPPIDPYNDTINDLSINDHYVVCAATWSGLKLWKKVPKVETTTTTSSFNTVKKESYSFESFEGELIQNRLMSQHNEPIIRCTFDTLQNNIVYFGDVYGRIIKVCIENVNEHAQEDLLGHQTSIITGLKYCRDKRAIASSSCEGRSYIWDPRKGNYQCAEIETKINCTNLDFVQNTIAICGIDNTKFIPVVKLYDIRNITNPLPPPPTKTTSIFNTSNQWSFNKPTTTTTSTTTSTTNSFFNKTATQNSSFKMPTATTSTTNSLFNKTSTPYSEIASYPPGGNETNPYLTQFTSIVLDRTGKNFVAGTIGGYIVSSRPNQKDFEETVLVKNTKRSVKQKTQYGATPANNIKNMDNSLMYRGINGLAMVQAPIRANKISAHPIFAATSCGSVVAFSAFRKSETTGGLPINIIDSDYVSPKQNAVTAIAVSPNGQMLTFAYGDDYRDGSIYRFSLDKDGNSSMKRAECRIKMIDITRDFKVKEGRF